MSRYHEYYFLYSVNQHFLYMFWWFLIFVWPLLLRKSNAKFLLASLKTFTNLKRPSSNPLERAYSGVQKLAGDCKKLDSFKMSILSMSIKF
jgi:hypothetical protein